MSPKTKEGNPAFTDSAKSEPKKALASLKKGNKPTKKAKKPGKLGKRARLA
jgi:hypothetical protein